MKIENIINGCHECRALVKLQEMNGNTLFMGVCGQPQNGNNFPVIVCTSVNKDVFKNPIKIPDTCPLEDYQRS